MTDIDPNEGLEQLRQEIAELAKISLDEVDDEELSAQVGRGWSITLEGHAYCLTCGCQIGESREAITGRKWCGMCRASLKGL